MSRIVIPIALIGGLLLLAPAARADWSPGDGYKMHYPQLPDPNGWDVRFTQGQVLADDFLCTGTGPIEDIHFWFSSHADQPFTISAIHASIHEDIPDPDGPGPLFSQPGPLLWERDFLVGQFIIRTDGTGLQGWYDPSTSAVIKPDHTQIFQANIVEILNPFIQLQGTIYWLDLSLITTQGELGWKTSLQHYNDDGVWSTSVIAPVWHELHDPLLVPPQSLDLAFVITPEPGTSALLLGGLILLTGLRRRRT